MTLIPVGGRIKSAAVGLDVFSATTDQSFFSERSLKEKISFILLTTPHI